jgi:ABC-type transporter Mla subunit MlaD
VGEASILRTMRGRHGILRAGLTARGAAVGLLLLIVALGGCGGSEPRPSRISATFDGDSATAFSNGALVHMRGSVVGRVTSKQIIRGAVMDSTRVWIRLRPGTPDIPTGFEPVVRGSDSLEFMRPAKAQRPRHWLHPVIAGTLDRKPAPG